MSSVGAPIGAKVGAHKVGAPTPLAPSTLFAPVKQQCIEIMTKSWRPKFAHSLNTSNNPGK
eukprot:1177001-Prymnesium_polylepis.1